MRDRYSPLPLCQPELAGNSNYPSSSFREALLYIYFPCSYSPRHIALLIFPSTCLTISVKQDFSRILRILNFALMNLPHFLPRPQGAFPWLSSKAREKRPGDEVGITGRAQGEGGGVLPYKKDRGAPRKISRTRLKGTRILFYGRVPNVTIDNRFVETRSHHMIALLMHSSTARSM